MRERLEFALPCVPESDSGILVKDPEWRQFLANHPQQYSCKLSRAPAVFMSSFVDRGPQRYFT